jgi:hypothetical protein
MLGARAGVILGSPGKIGTLDVSPVHVALRGAYHFGDDPFGRQGLRPFLFATFGYGHTATVTSVDVVTEGVGQQQLDVYHTAGTAFVGGGFGAQYALTESVALSMQLGVQQMFPSPALVISPSVGLEYGM